MTRDEVSQLEEMNFNAWPALKTVHYDGWLLRCTGGASRRPNSVNCIAPSTIALNEKVDKAAAFYARWQQRLVFRLTPLADDGLDRILDQRGHAIEEPTFVQVSNIDPKPVPADVQVFTAVSDAWIAAALEIRGLTQDEAAIFAMQHRTVAVDSAWVLIKVNERPAAVGVAALERGWAGLHGIYVAKGVRRRGLARKVSEALLGFGYAHGARRAWLQVAGANAPALALYHSLGFRNAYSYHHRVGLK